MKSIILFTGIILLNILFIWSCSDDEVIISINCETALIEHFEMEPYNGEFDTTPFECLTFLRYYEYEGSNFAYTDNHCADYAYFSLTDCDGEEICKTNEGDCYDMITNGMSLGIIGIEKQ